MSATDLTKLGKTTTTPNKTPQKVRCFCPACFFHLAWGPYRDETSSLKGPYLGLVTHFATPTSQS